MKKTYFSPALDIVEFEAEDILRTSGVDDLTDSVDGGESIGGMSDNYDEQYNASAGGRITLN